jgi:hypothetical protein
MAQDEPYLDWVKTYGSNIPGGIDGGGATNIKVGKDNDLYVLGGFRGIMNFGNGEPEAEFVTGTGTGEASWFIIKYDSIGNFLWGNTIAGGTNFNIMGFELDDEDNIYIAGSLYHPTDFNFDENESFVLSPSEGINNSNRSTPFIVKYDDLGNLIWGHRLDISSVNSSFAHISNLSLSNEQNQLLISGLFNDTINLGTNGENYHLISGVSSYTESTVFYAKYSLEGDFILGDNFSTYIKGQPITNVVRSFLDSDGNFYLNGPYTGNIYFDSDSLTPLLTSEYDDHYKRDLFIVKLDNEGGFLWSSSINGNVWLGMNSLNVYENRLSLIFSSYDSVEYNSDQNSELIFYKNFGLSMSQWDSESGEFLFDKVIQCNDSIYCDYKTFEIKADSKGNNYLTGWFRGVMDFDPDPNKEYGLSSSLSESGAYMRDIFLAKYAPSGDLLWAFNLSCDYNTNSPRGLDFSHGNAPIIAGSFVGYHNFSPHYNEPHYVQASNYLNDDMFIAKYNFEHEHEVIDFQNIQLFPNPSNDQHQIELTGYTDQSIEIKLYDPQGRLLGNVYEGKLEENTMLEFDVSHLSNGFYLYDIQLETERRALRFIKQ